MNFYKILDSQYKHITVSHRGKRGVNRAYYQISARRGLKIYCHFSYATRLEARQSEMWDVLETEKNNTDYAHRHYPRLVPRITKLVVLQKKNRFYLGYIVEHVKGQLLGDALTYYQAKKFIKVVNKRFRAINLTHGDLHPWNVIRVNNNEIKIIDFEFSRVKKRVSVRERKKEIIIKAA